MRVLLVCLLLLGLCSCKSEVPLKQRNFSTVKIETLLQDSLLNVRALEINEGRVVVATSSGKILRSILSYMNYFEEGNYWLQTEDSLLPNNFRSIAFQGDKTFTLSISSPAKLFYDGRLVYYETHPKAFYDSMDFWNDQEGIAIGDPTDSCMSIIITRDGGERWTKLSCDDLPKAKEGEAAFAASDTNIAIVGVHTWVATGGKASRILYSPDKGKTWEVFETPILQGKVTTGMYSLDFYDENNGFAIGGDYTKPNDTLNNKIRTADGGRSWEVVANGKGPGYRSCVQYVPNSNAKELVVVGFKGIDYSNDSGDTWKHLSDEGFYTIRFLNDSVAYAAGQGRISQLIFKE
ncbi:WD40/YVTN/BNR-like repeat-containing protein [Winogradskyella aquimaris]|uniref:Oxidoreductase n=1 Tax=Winogradskyella aquimaris TaxID=864074 RepID=A0ABU5EMQ9_9FLAO|nr:oxidoreductase [Winogradskyella aquimaris]MDY2587739.1 oxidoreductase [Winogradskyella aquimaris]